MKKKNEIKKIVILAIINKGCINKNKIVNAFVTRNFPVAKR